jgi:hypothetical protein
MVGKKNEIEEVRDQVVDVITFQLSRWAILIPCGGFAFLLITLPVIIFIGINSVIMTLMNRLRIANNQPYKYPTFLKILKK